ncbi:MAG: S8 family serine peptidase, partial [Promethearchaeota archaeon]
MKSGPLEDQRKHIDWSRDLDGDFIDDAFLELDPGEKTDVLLQLNECSSADELSTRFSPFGTIERIGELIAYVYLSGVAVEDLPALAQDPFVAALEFPLDGELFLDTGTRSVRNRASNTYTPETFAEAFGFDGTGVNIAIADSGVDDGHNAFAAKFLAGYNALTATPGNPIDDMIWINSGLDGVCDTAASPDDNQVVPVNQGAPNTIGIRPGPNGMIDTGPAGDDFLFMNLIFTGPDGICNTAAAGDDVQAIAVGNGARFRACVSSGPNGVLDTATTLDDAIRDVHHGTHVAGIAMGLGVGPGCSNADDGSTPNNCQGMAPGARLIDVKVASSLGSVTQLDLLNGLEWIWNDGRADVVNMSLGWNENDDGTSTMSKAVNALVANDIAVSVSSGNSAQNLIGRVAAAELAVTVGNSRDRGTVDRDDDLMNAGSTFGPRVDIDVANPTLGMFKPDIVAPGTSINAAQGGTTNGYHSLSGTSMSSPHVAGAMALLLDMRSDLPPGAMKDLLRRSAFETPAHTAAGASFPAVDPVYNVNWGRGLLDMFEAGELLDNGISDLSFTDCTGPHPAYPDNRRCLLSGGKPSYANNVDIQLATDPPVQGVPNTINIRIENRGTATAEKIVVSVGVKDFAAGVLEFYDVGSKEVAMLGPMTTTVVSFPWTPSASNHQCIQASIDYGFDTDFSNNLTQRNVAPVAASSPAVANFRVENPLNEKADIILELRLDPEAKKILEV